MRDLVSCFNEHAVKVSDASCSGSSNAAGPTDHSVKATVTSSYRTQLSTHMKSFIINITWSETPGGPTLSLGFNHDASCHLLKKRKGSKSYTTAGKSTVGLFWDYSASVFNGPEPVSEFFVAVVIDTEVVLSLGDLTCKFLNDKMNKADFSLISREEKVLYRSAYSTRVKFGEEGKEHEVTIRFDTKEGELVVSVDRKRAVMVRRLQWNFRGNQTVFVEGAPVDVMWDVGSVRAVFVLRRRSALQSRLWLEEEMLSKEKGVAGFSLLIQAFRNC